MRASAASYSREMEAAHQHDIGRVKQASCEEVLISRTNSILIDVSPKKVAYGEVDIAVDDTAGTL